MLASHPTATDRAKADRLAKIDILANGNAIHDLIVSCYETNGEGGRTEYVHEQRLSDGTCRCGKYRLHRWDVTLTHPERTPVHTFTWAVTYGGAVARVSEVLDREEWWEGFSFKINRTPSL